MRDRTSSRPDRHNPNIGRRFRAEDGRAMVFLALYNNQHFLFYQARSGTATLWRMGVDNSTIFRRFYSASSRQTAMVYSYCVREFFIEEAKIK